MGWLIDDGLYVYTLLYALLILNHYTDKKWEIGLIMFDKIRRDIPQTVSFYDTHVNGSYKRKTKDVLNVICYNKGLSDLKRSATIIQ